MVAGGLSLWERSFACGIKPKDFPEDRKATACTPVPHPNTASASAIIANIVAMEVLRLGGFIRIRTTTQENREDRRA